LARPWRVTIAVLRFAAVAMLVLVVLNPGRWRQPVSPSTRSFLVLVDRSSSMAVPDENGGTRWSAGVKVADVAIKAAEKSGYVPVGHTFAEALDSGTVASPWEKAAADGTGSALPAALDAALAAESARGRSPAGVVVISDGRQTGVMPELDAAVARARAFAIPVHTIALGGSWQAKDLRVASARRQVLAYPGRPVKVPVVLESRGLGPIEAEVILRSEDGTEAARSTVRLSGDGKSVVTLAFEAPANGGTYSVESPARPGEEVATNNRDTVRLRVLSGKTRVFIAEGAPYWDSKFLAQLLRQVPFMEVDSVHRLSDERFFFLSSDGTAEDTAGAADARPVFPSTAEALSRYDLVVFGKACEHFLTPERMALLTAFIRDQGGAVLFARGKPYSVELPGINALEPVEWGGGQVSSFRFTPAAEGEAAGLFGEALPAVADPLWTSLPLLQDAREVQTPKPFARVLAQGVSETGGVTTPLLVVRRFGLGVTGLINADGLWKWDFYPEARELGNMYEEFWTQLIQWMASYSEFLPGQDFSLRVSSARVLPGDAVTFQIGWRGQGKAPEPRLEVVRGDEVVSTIVAAPATSDDGRPRWQGTVRAGEAGDYRLRLVHDTTSSPVAAGGLPEATLKVASPPGELDHLDADPEYLANISKATGGQTLRVSESAALFDNLAAAASAETREPPVFQPLWTQSSIFLLLTGFFAADWIIRRRHGLS
jgi:uncharacterized membrane protein